jgi:hypothetical protein
MMGAFLGTIGVLGFIIFLIWGIVSAIRKTGRAKKRFLFAAGFLILIIVGLSITPDSNTTKTSDKNTSVPPTVKDNTSTKQDNATQKEETPKPVEETPKEKMLKSIKALINSKQAFDSGDYIKGDIPAGDYAFIAFEGSGKYFEETDASNNILDNENFDSFGYVYIHATGNIKNSGVLISTTSFPTLGVTGAKQIYEVLNDVHDYKDAGIYKVGVDIPAGTHIIQSQGEAYVESSSGPVGNGEIVQNNNFNGRYSISVSNGQYLTVSRGTIAQ